MDSVVKASDKYTGAELEKAVKEAIARAWTDGKRKMVTADLLSAIRDTKPISQMMDRKINELREWARDRARYASSEAAKLAAPGKQTVSTASGKKLSVEESMSGLEGIETPKEKAKRQKAELDKAGARLPETTEDED